MAIRTSAIRIIFAWFAQKTRAGQTIEQVPTQSKLQRPQTRIRWPDDEVEAQRVRQANMDLMKFQHVNHGF